jgi:competence protein ComEA
MEKGKQTGIVIAAAAVALLTAGYFFPHHPAAAIPLGDATVPPQLAAANMPSTPDGASFGVQPAATPARVAVYVCGDVRHPGVYSMTSNGRVADGIARAGGALPDADLEQLNLAQPLADAMKIDVPRKGERPLMSMLADESSGLAPATAHRAHHRRGRSSHKLQPGQTLDINTASEEELTQLPGVGPSLAARIVEYRTENGPFQSADDLQNVSGIGPSKFDKMLPYVRL